MDFLLKLRTAAMRVSNRRFKNMCRIKADSLDAALMLFQSAPTEANLLRLNGAMAAAHRVYRDLPPEQDPAGPGTPIAARAA